MFKFNVLIHAVGFVPALLLLLVLQLGVNVWAFPEHLSVDCNADTILVMGAAQYDGVPSPVFQKRLDKAYDLYSQGCGENILVTGGKLEGDRFTEGASGVAYLKTRGLTDDRLLSETSSRTSYQNLHNSQALIGESKLLIVTDDMHSYRTQWLAHRLNLNASMAPTETRGLQLAYGLREWSKLMAYNVGVIR